MNEKQHTAQSTQTDEGVEEVISNRGLPGREMNRHFVMALITAALLQTWKVSGYDGFV